MDQTDVVIVGGGLAGLTAAVVAARGGSRVTLFDARSNFGGRARSQVAEGFVRNEGPRALYSTGEAARILKTLGIIPTGLSPVLSGPALWADGRSGELPLGPSTLARTKLLGTRAKAELMAAMGRMAVGNAAAHRDVSFADWLDRHTSTLEVRRVLEMFTRLGTYVADVELLSAEAAMLQARLGSKGVLYLDGGWQQLVDALTKCALDAGVVLCGGHSVQSIADSASGTWQVHTADHSVTAPTVIAAGLSSRQLGALLGDRSPSVTRWAAAARPAMAACLDVCLQRIPVAENRISLGLDRPWYASFHTPAARLAPPAGGEVVHVMKYLPAGELDRSPADDRAELEGVLDRVQPGWREVTVHTRYLHRMVACSDIARPGTSLEGRPGAVVPEAPGLMIAGDWVGPHGMLADAAVSSGARAAELAAKQLAAA